jgi:hypothetical protein
MRIQRSKMEGNLFVKSFPPILPCLEANSYEPVSLKKRLQIDELEEEVKSLRVKVRYQDREERECFFDSLSL